MSRSVFTCMSHGWLGTGGFPCPWPDCPNGTPGPTFERARPVRSAASYWTDAAVPDAVPFVRDLWLRTAWAHGKERGYSWRRHDKPVPEEPRAPRVEGPTGRQTR